MLTVQFRISSRSIFVCVLCSLLAPAAIAPVSAESIATEYRLKAVYLYNFLKFVSWPPETEKRSNTIEVCVLGESPFAGELDFMRGKKIQGRSIHVTLHDSLIHSPACDLVFISRSEQAVIAATIRGLRSQSILTVSDIDRFAAEGGIIGFSTQGDRIALEINVNAARAAKLEISSKLLEVASIEAGSRKAGSAQ